MLLALATTLLNAEVIVTKNKGNIENVSDIDTTGNVFYFVHEYQTKSIDRDEVIAIIYADGQYVTISHTSDKFNTIDTDAHISPNNTSAWVDLQVGSLITFSDGSQGIVFYTDNKGHGMVVSLKETKVRWDTGKKRSMQNIPEIPDIETVYNESNVVRFMGEGAEYTAAIVRHLPSYLCPAATWSQSLGEGWYLPSVFELVYLLRVANMGHGKNGPISQALKANGGMVLNGDWYWASSEAERTEAWNVSDGGYASTEDKDEANAVRAIRTY